MPVLTLDRLEFLDIFSHEREKIKFLSETRTERIFPNVYWVMAIKAIEMSCYSVVR